MHKLRSVKHWRVDPSDSTPHHRKISEYFSLFALLLSLPAACFTLYQNFVAEPAAEEVNRQRLLLEIVAKIQDINKNIQKVSYSQASDLQKITEMTAWNTQKVPAIENAASIVDELKSDPAASTLLLLGSEYISIGRIETGMEYVNTAVENSNEGYQKSEAYRLRALLRIQVNGKDAVFDALSDLENAEGALDQYADVAKAYSVAEIQGSRLWIKSSTQSCEGIEGDAMKAINSSTSPLLVQAVQKMQLSKLTYIFSAFPLCRIPNDMIEKIRQFKNSMESTMPVLPALSGQGVP